jgi:flavin reductase (DIM6/NTAB) family NADH-FMN oxidoreductase RutF/rubredoxin
MREALSKLSYGLYALGVQSDKAKNMCIINTAIQVSSEPIHITAALSKNNFSHDLVKEAKQFCVSILDQNTSMEVIARFGFATGANKDKFEDFDYNIDATYNPYLKEALAALSVKVINMIDIGSHTLFIGQIVEAIDIKDGQPLTYDYYKKIKKGTVPKNAPTYNKSTENNVKKYQCTVCGYIYDGDIPFEQLPDDYKCPVCNYPKSVFKLI